MPLALLMLLPLYWMLLTSLQTLPEARHFPPELLPKSITGRTTRTHGTRRPSAGSSPTA